MTAALLPRSLYLQRLLVVDPATGDVEDALFTDLSDLVVPPVYDPSLRDSAAEELDQWFERGDIRLAVYWAELIGLNRTDQVIHMSFELFDQGVLNPVMFWTRQKGRMEFRNHPRFMELVEYVGLASYWDEVGWPGFCENRGNGYFCGLDWMVE